MTIGNPRSGIVDAPHKLCGLTAQHDCNVPAGGGVTQGIIEQIRSHKILSCYFRRLDLDAGPNGVIPLEILAFGSLDV